MDKNEKWLEWAVELQALAQAGLYYSKDAFDIERFGRIREISAEMLALQGNMPLKTVKELFCNEVGYQTPKIDTRAAIIKDGKILLVQENDGLWSLPGGWCDVNISVGDNVVKESFEEAGATVKPVRIVAVQDRERHNSGSYAIKICKIFVLCEYLGGEFVENSETLASTWFSFDELPQLSENKNTAEQIKMCFEAKAAKYWEALFD